MHANNARQNRIVLNRLKSDWPSPTSIPQAIRLDGVRCRRCKDKVNGDDERRR